MSAPREIIVVSDQDALAESAAMRMIARMQAHGGRVAICLTGGSTPLRLYRLLTMPEWRSRIPWDRVHWFIGDERFVPEDDSDSNMGMARRAFLDACAFATSIHPIPTDLPDPGAAAHAYDKKLRAFRAADAHRRAEPLFDLVLMGIGPDGHTASLFPNDPATLETSRWVVGVPRANAAPFIPRVTLTFPALASSREMLFMVSGKDKRSITERALRDDSLPAARAASDGNTVWLIDRDAAPEHLHG